MPLDLSVASAAASAALCALGSSVVYILYPPSRMFCHGMSLNWLSEWLSSLSMWFTTIPTGFCMPNPALMLGSYF